MDNTSEHVLFKQINRLFWLIWILLPFYLYKAIPWLESPPGNMFLSQQELCSVDATQQLSVTGQWIAWIYFGINTLIYLTLFGLMHHLVHTFAKGEVFLKKTLTFMGYIAGLVISWPLIDVVSFNVIGWLLQRMGELSVFHPDFQVDVMTLGSGAFLLVIRVILSHALKLHDESRYTI